MVIMPAQKLTKARLAQILITLMVLVAVFFWRTFTHETPDRVDCSQKERCNVTIAEVIITINRNTKGILIETPKNSSLKIDLNQSGDYMNAAVSYNFIEWKSISNNKVINFKINKSIVVVQL